MGTMIMIKDQEVTVMEEISKTIYLEMVKTCSENVEQTYLSWKENLDSEYGY
ncbi:hypothetical protein HOO54_09030 [Bacillus sp. WMMC1349]|uniref:hypothetical protein n=1 Tax=Bacillus sp. WMMC1349 TaxID=2736254 RepID=UPI001552A261|nr:hypothetical protein [Bacillus sp. WMMC1349]NPC92362.1 hypothetical protein [Bacillus sp. WMMC1349]